MNSQAAVNSLFSGYATSHTLHSKDALRLQDLLSRLMFGTPLQNATPMQLQALQIAAATAINPSGVNPLGLTDGGALFADTYRSLVMSGGIMSATGSHIYGHSPQAMAVASGIMSQVAVNAGGSSITERGIGGSTKLATEVIGQMIRREGLSGLGGTQVLKREGKTETLKDFATTLFHHKGTTYKEKVNIATQEMGGEIYAELLQVAAQKFQDSNWRAQYGIDAEMAAKLEGLDISNYDALSTDLRKVVDRAVIDLAKSEEGKKARDRVMKRVGNGEAFTLLSDTNVKLETEMDVRRAREAARKQNQYTVLDEQAAKSIKEAQRRQLELTGEMSEVFGTDDANKLLEIAKLFGVRTLDTERDVTEMKRVMDAARARAESTGRSLADVMGEMQGIAAVGAQALGRFGVSASFIQHAVSQTQASEASRAAGLDFRTPEQVQASLVAEEHNFQNNNLNWMFAYEHIKANSATASAEDLAWVAEIERVTREGRLDDATAKAWERHGVAYNTKSVHNVSVEQMQKTVTEGSIMHAARASYQRGNVEDNLRGHTADILKGARVGDSYEATTIGRALFNKDKGIYKDITTKEAQELAYAEDMEAIGRQYGGDLKLFRDDYRTVKGFNKIENADDRAKAIEEWKNKKLDRAKELGATEKQLKEIEKTLDTIVKWGSSEGGDVAVETAMNMLRGHTLNNYTGTFGQLEQREIQLASQQKLITTKTSTFMEEGAGYSQFGKRGDGTVDGLLSLSAANGGALGSNNVLLDRNTGVFNVAAINTLDPTKLAAAGYEAGEYVAAHTFAVAADANGKLNFAATKDLAKQLEAQVEAHKDTLADKELAKRVADGKATDEDVARYKTAKTETDRATSRLNVMRSTFNIADGQSVSAGMAQMSDKQLEAAMYDAENRSHSVMRDKNGNMVIGARNDSQTAAVDTALQEELLYAAAIMNIGAKEVDGKRTSGFVRGYVSRANAGMKYAATYKDGNIITDPGTGKVNKVEDYGTVEREKGVVAGKTYDMSTEEGRKLASQDRANALLAVQNSKEFAFIHRTMEAAGTTEITEATGTVKRTTADGKVKAYELASADDRDRLVVDTMNSNLDYQREVRAQAAEGDNVEALNAVAKHGLALNDFFNGDTQEHKARRSHAYGISMARNDKQERVTGKADYDDDDEVRDAVREQLGELSSLETRRSEIIKKHRSGEISDEEAAKQMREVIKEAEEASEKFHKLTDYYGVSDDTRRNMGGQRLLSKEEADKAGYEEQLEQLSNEKDAVTAANMTKGITEAIGTNTDDVDETAKKNAAEEEKFGIFKEWNRQLTTNEGHATINATILAALQTLSAAFINDDGYNLKIDY